MSSKVETDISVIVPVYNSANRLELCLQALEKQTYPRSRYEIIAVDNGSTDNSIEIASSFKDIRVLREDQPGSYSARNKGIEVARGEVIAFTDSDCIPDQAWIENGLKAIRQSPNCGLVAGEIHLFFKEPDKPTSVEIYESIELDFSQKKLLEEQQFGLTANLFTTKDVLNKVGSFNSKLKSGGDRDWGHRVLKSGYEQIYAKDALVKHPARYSWWQLYKRVTRITGGSNDLERLQQSSRSRLSMLMKYFGLAFTPPFRSLFRIWGNSRFKKNNHKIKFIAAMLFVRYVTAWERIRLNLGGKSRRW